MVQDASEGRIAAATSKMADAGTFGLTCRNAEAILVANDANRMAKAGQPSDGSHPCKTWLAKMFICQLRQKELGGRPKRRSLLKLSPMPKDGK